MLTMHAIDGQRQVDPRLCCRLLPTLTLVQLLVFLNSHLMLYCTTFLSFMEHYFNFAPHLIITIKNSYGKIYLKEISKLNIRPCSLLLLVYKH